MTESNADAETTRTRVPWWHIESPLRRRIKGRHVRRAILVACIVNVAMVAYAPRLLAPADAIVGPVAPGLRAALPAPSARSADALALMAAAAP